MGSKPNALIHLERELWRIIFVMVMGKDPRPYYANVLMPWEAFRNSGSGADWVPKSEFQLWYL